MCVKKTRECKTSFFLGGAGNDSKIAWVKWESILLPYGAGGLNLGSLKSKNWALICKWWWRFKSETTSLWVKVIKSIYGPSGGFELVNDSHVSSSTWANIVKAGGVVDSLGLSFRDSFIKSVGNGSTTSFWNEVWLGDVTLKSRFKRLHKLETNRDAAVSERVTWDGSKMAGTWCWSRLPERRASKRAD
ncbi:uncharacterized mitochondrial protein AtMg00310-like [Rutidosis leptorrhynchoides]|uniref:uncharacterized mitochondrial protein AtMg00310-like n=1 Tax=Rutidosis leptorrhynchoides TaxID=125765 RepID=UPI003A99DD3F